MKNEIKHWWRSLGKGRGFVSCRVLNFTFPFQKIINNFYIYKEIIKNKDYLTVAVK